MVTGDNVKTAVAIAKNAGILDSEYKGYNERNQSYEVLEGK